MSLPDLIYDEPHRPAGCDYASEAAGDPCQRRQAFD
jgi:hypothetical protein